MSASPLVYFESWDINRRLAELELEEAPLLQAVQVGFSAWAACTSNHPPTAPGFYAWSEAVRTLREQLASSGWRKLNETNCAFTVNREGTIAIIVATGDSDTGKKDGHPCTSSEKGPRTVNAVQANKKQEWLFPEMVMPLKEIAKAKGRVTWILLMHRDSVAEEVRCELSRPISISQKGHVDGWGERIILSPTRFDSHDASKLTDNKPEPQTPEIKIEIKRRA